MNLLEEAVTKGLERAFEQHCLVFWYDDGGNGRNSAVSVLTFPVSVCARSSPKRTNLP